MENKQLFRIIQKHRLVISTYHKDGNKEWSIETRMFDHYPPDIKAIKGNSSNNTIGEYGVYPVTIIEINNSTSVKYRGCWIFDHDMSEGRTSKVVIINDNVSNGVNTIATISGFAESIEDAMNIIDKRLIMDSLKHI